MSKSFKRATAIVLAALMMIPTISSNQVVKAATTNDTVVLVDESFEGTGYNPDIQPRGDSHTQITVVEQSAENHELNISGRSLDWHGIQIPLAANSVTGATITASMKVRSADTKCILGVQYDHGDKTEYIWLKDLATTESSYVDFSGTYSVPSDAQNVRIYLQGTDTADFKNIMVDDIKITAQSTNSGNDPEPITIIENFERATNIAIARSSTLAVVDGAGTDGSRALFVSGRTNNWNGVNFDANAYVGQTLQISAKVKSASPSMKISIQYDEEATTQYREIAIGATGGSEYVDLSGSFAIPAEVTNVFIYIETGDAGDLSDFYLDDFTLVAPNNGDTGSGDTIVEDFEGETHIGIARAATLTVVDNAGIDGSKALMVSGRTQDWNGVNFDANAYVRKTVRVSAQVKSTSPSMKLSLQYDDASGETQYKTVAQATTGSDSYVPISGTYNIPANATNVFLYLEASNLIVDEITTCPDFYVDHFTITQISQPSKSIQEDLMPIKEYLAKDTAIAGKAGVAIPVSALDDEVRMKLVTKHFSSITLENEMKPEGFLGRTPTLDTNGNPILNFSNADKVLDFVLQYNEEHPDDMIRLRGHVLLWHSQTPGWFFRTDYSETGEFVSKEEMISRLDYYIKTVMEHYDGADSKYAGLIYAWDVVNEQIDNGTIRVGDGSGGTSNWYQIFKGDDTYIKEAFAIANKYAPSHMKLFYNDYGETDSVKAAAIHDLIVRIKDYPGTRIDGMGMQGHYNMLNPSIDSFEAAIRLYASVVDEIQITELDIASSQGELTKQGYRYKALFDKMYELRQEGINITAVTVWGSHDGASWLNGSRPQYPLLFDDDYQAKPAYYGIVDPSQLEPNTNSLTALYSAKENWSVMPETIFANSDTEAVFKVLWTNDHLKVQVKVKDNTAAADDKIAVYVDSENSKSEKAFTPYILDRNNAEVTADGYTGTISIPISEMKIGKIIGLDVVVINNGQILSWNDLKNTQDTTSKYYGEITLKPYAEFDYGKATIDGELDSVWTKQSSLPLTVKTGNIVATANVRAMWDEEYLYVYAEVTDPHISKSNANAWEQDSLEVFIDQNNAKASSYEPDDSQYRINFDNEASFNGAKCNADNLKSFTKLTANGYIVEAAFRWTDVTPAAGTILGVDFQINDDAGSGSRAGTYNWFDATGSGYANPSVFGTVTFIKSDPGNGNGGGNNGGNNGGTGNAGDSDVKDETDTNDNEKLFVQKTLEDAAKDSEVISNLLHKQKVTGAAILLTKPVTGKETVTITVKDPMANGKVYIYRVNEETGKLETVAYGFTKKVDQEGQITFTVLEAGTYVVLTKKANSKLCTPLRDQIKVYAAKASIKVGKKTSIKLELPISLELVKSLKNKTSDEAIGAVTVTYKVSDPAIASVDKNGNVTAKKAGKVIVTTTVKLYNKTSRSFVTPLTIVK